MQIQLRKDCGDSMSTRGALFDELMLLGIEPMEIWESFEDYEFAEDYENYYYGDGDEFE